jgi:hypothetical protein
MQYHYRSAEPYPNGKPELLIGKVELRESTSNHIFGDIDFTKTSKFKDYRSSVLIAFHSTKNDNFFVVGYFSKQYIGKTVLLQNPNNSDNSALLLLCENSDIHCDSPVGYFKGNTTFKTYSRGERPGSIKELELLAPKLQFETLVYNN